MCGIVLKELLAEITPQKVRPLKDAGVLCSPATGERPMASETVLKCIVKEEKMLRNKTDLQSDLQILVESVRCDDEESDNGGEDEDITTSMENEEKTDNLDMENEEVQGEYDVKDPPPQPLVEGEDDVRIHHHMP